MHLGSTVLAVADVEGHLRKEIGGGEQVSEDPVMVCQPLYLKRAAAFFPGLLDSIQRDFNCGKNLKVSTFSPP